MLVKRWPSLHPRTAQLNSVRDGLEIVGLQALSAAPLKLRRGKECKLFAKEVSPVEIRPGVGKAGREGEAAGEESFSLIPEDVP